MTNFCCISHIFVTNFCRISHIFVTNLSFFLYQQQKESEVFVLCTKRFYTVDRRYTIEVGGKSKDGKQIAREQSAFIAADNIDYPVGNKIPLWAFGLVF